MTKLWQQLIRTKLGRINGKLLGKTNRDGTLHIHIILYVSVGLKNNFWNCALYVTIFNQMIMVRNNQILSLEIGVLTVHLVNNYLSILIDQMIFYLSNILESYIMLAGHRKNIEQNFIQVAAHLPSVKK